jgi:hypothetical protein
MTNDPSRLVLGGHSFIEPLGNDPEPPFDEQCAIVTACLDQGIRYCQVKFRCGYGRLLVNGPSW